MELPDDVLLHICDYGQSRALSAVCSSMFHILQHRHLALGPNAEHAIAALQHEARVRTLSVRWPAPCARSLRDLKNLPALHTLTLDLRGDWEEGCPRALAQLASAPALRRLTLDLSGCLLEPGDVGALATLSQSETLEVLHLDLSFADLSNYEAQALVALKETQRLHTLKLNLGSNKLGAGVPDLCVCACVCVCVCVCACVCVCVCVCASLPGLVALPTVPHALPPFSVPLVVHASCSHLVS